MNAVLRAASPGGGTSWDAELPAGEVARRFRVTRPAISQHLRVLKGAGLVAERRAGTRRFYRARPEVVAEVRAFLEDVWSDSLRRLTARGEFVEVVHPGPDPWTA